MYLGGRSHFTKYRLYVVQRGIRAKCGDATVCLFRRVVCTSHSTGRLLCQETRVSSIGSSFLPSARASSPTRLPYHEHPAFETETVDILSSFGKAPLTSQTLRKRGNMTRDDVMYKTCSYVTEVEYGVDMNATENCPFTN